MDLSLIVSAFLLGLAGTPHCAAMCGAPCAAVIGRGRADVRATALGFHLARVMSYALVGGLAAGGVGVLGAAGSAAPFVRPLWTLLHMAALALGLWMLVTARQPAFMTRIGRPRAAPAVGAGGWQVMQTPWGGAAAGAAWVAWPCGLLQSALVVAALGNTVAVGATAMAAFALASAGGLQAAPFLMERLQRWSGDAVRWAVRIAGLTLAAGSAWALSHDLMARVAAYCAT